MQNPNPETTRLPLREAELDVHVEQRIIERGNLRHLYNIEWDEVDQEHIAVMKSRGATSIWRVVQDAIKEAGWKLSR